MAASNYNNIFNPLSVNPFYSFQESLPLHKVIAQHNMVLPINHARKPPKKIRLNLLHASHRKDDSFRAKSDSLA